MAQSILLDGKIIPCAVWAGDVERHAARFYLLQHQQWLACRAGHLDSACLEGWWPQRGSDFTRGLRTVQGVALQLLNPAPTAPTTKILRTYALTDETVAEVVSDCGPNFSDASRVVLQTTESLLLDACQESLTNDSIPAHETLRRKLAYICAVVGTDRPVSRGMLANLQSEVELERIMLQHWLSEKNTLRALDPEFFAKFTVALRAIPK